MSERRSGFARWDVRVSIAGVLVTFAVVIAYLSDPSPGMAQALVALWAAWALAPPAWFLFEWSSFEEDDGGKGFERLKYSHELASKFWVAGVTVLSALLLQAKDLLPTLKLPI